MTTTDRQLTALEMARHLVKAIQRGAERIESDELGAYLDRTGDRAFASAQLAAALATVSIAESLASIANDISYIADDGGSGSYRRIEDVDVAEDGDPPL